MSGTPKEEWLPAKPFIRWLLKMRHREAVRMGVPDERALTALSRTLKMSERHLREYMALRVDDLVPYATVDRLVARQGTWSMYDLYSEAVLEAVSLSTSSKRKPRCHECGADLLRKASRCGFCVEERKICRNERC